MKKIKRIILLSLISLLSIACAAAFSACEFFGFIKNTFSESENGEQDSNSGTEYFPDSDEEEIPDESGDGEHIHYFSEIQIIEDADCVNAGSRLLICACGQTQEEVILPYGHDLIEKDGKSPTCSEYGWNAYRECARCSYNDKSELPPLEHNYGEWVITYAPTCVSEGEETRVCLNDETHFQIRTLSKTEHIHGELITIEKPTCESEGSAKCECVNCGLLLYTEKLSRLGHDYGKWEICESADCTKAGKEARVCSRDESHKEERTLAKLPHTTDGWKDTVLPACEAEGKRSKTCLNCFETLAEEIIAPLGHDYEDWTVKKHPTCLNDGEEVRICANDYGHCLSRIIPSAGHKPEQIIELAPDCGIEGCGSKICTECREVLETFIIPALEHEYGNWVEFAAPTCTAAGAERRYCIRNEKHFEERILEKTGHSESEWQITVSPDCEKDGERIKKCESCGEELSTEILPSYGHSYDDNLCLQCGKHFGGTIGMEWTLNSDGGYTLCGIGNAEQTQIIIPSRYNGKPVTQIAEKAFYNCNAITSVFIPESVKKIGSYAFYGSALEKIQFENIQGWYIGGQNTVERIPSEYFENGEVLYLFTQNKYYSKSYWICI